MGGWDELSDDEEDGEGYGGREGREGSKLVIRVGAAVCCSRLSNGAVLVITKAKARALARHVV